MFFHLSPRDARPIYRQIVDEVQGAIATGRLHEGSALTSTRQLARELRINPNTVKQAYRELEAAGLIENRRGLGMFVTSNAAAGIDRSSRLAEIAERAVEEARQLGLETSELIDAIRSHAARQGDERAEGSPRQ